jgi:hypothetical protein
MTDSSRTLEQLEAEHQTPARPLGLREREQERE